MAKKKNRYQVMDKVVGIITHPRPHLDEIFALWLLYQFGGKLFPGVEESPIEIWGGNGWVDGKPPEYWEDEGYILLGVGGSRFDEHPDPVRNTSGRPGECVATLVAKELGVYNDPPLQQLLNFVLGKDTLGKGNGWDLGTLINLMYKTYPDDPLQVINWAMKAFYAKYDEQRKFFACGEEFAKSGRVLEVYIGPENPVKIAVVESDNPKMGSFCRSCEVQAAVVIQRRSTGHIAIFPNQWYQRNKGLSLVEVARVIRFLEQEFSGRVITTDWRDLEKWGTIPGAEKWYFQKESQMFLNGSLARDDVDPTRIPFKVLVDSVKMVLRFDAFEASRAKQCCQGRCSSSPQDPCLWYPWGLRRCRAVRQRRHRK